MLLLTISKAMHHSLCCITILLMLTLINTLVMDQSVPPMLFRLFNPFVIHGLKVYVEYMVEWMLAGHVESDNLRRNDEL